MLDDPRLSVAARYRAGGRQRLLGGDFYDLVQAPDGWVHALIGDVCGHGPSEAALGVCLRVAWRALVLAGQPTADVLSAVQRRAQARAAGGRHVRHRLHGLGGTGPAQREHAAGRPPGAAAGHSEDRITELTAPACPPAGLNDTGKWPSSEVELGDRWSLLLYTDGLIEGRISRSPYRLGAEGLMGLVRDALGAPPFDPGRISDDALLGQLIDQVRDLNSGDLNDDIAMLGLGCS